MQIDADDFIKVMEEERRNHPVKMNKGLAIECIETQRQFVDELTCEAFDMAVKALKEPERTGWIPDSKPPTENGPYLVWMPFAPEGHHITVTEWCGSYWNIKTPITAYMPLPEPYKEPYKWGGQWIT